jgi:hypothetical protein
MYIIKAYLNNVAVFTKVWSTYPTPRELQVYKASNPRYTWSKVEY